MTKTHTFIVLPALGALMLIGGAIAGYASISNADTASSSSSGFTGMMGRLGDRAPHVGGEITAINGSTITINAGGRHGTGTYTINASGATVMKDGAASDLSSLAVGNRIVAEGTIDGANVTATKVMSGQFGPHMGGKGRHGKGPGVMGTVSAVSGTTLTVTGMDGQSYTVNAGSAQVQKMSLGSLSDIAVGDQIGVHGTLSGTTVEAQVIMDGLPIPPAQN